MSSLSERLSNLSPAQRELFLKKLQAQTAQQAPKALSIPLVDRNQPIKLSFAQQRLWFLSQFDGNLSAYNIPIALRLEGTLQEDVLLNSFQAIVNRHAVLRTHFVLRGGEPVQVIAEEMALPLERLDWRSHSAEEIEQILTTTLKQEAQHFFQLQQGPLFRVVLIQSRPTEHYLIAALHHTITDGWSMNILVQELIAHYQNNGQSTTLAPLPLQYVDYSQWQRQWLTESAAAEQLAYWKTHLQGMAPLLELPTDRPRPPVQTFQGQTLEKHLPAALVTQLKALANRTGSTLFMVLEAALALLLSRLSRQSDIAIGSPVANRTTAELEPLIGFFANTLVFRNDLSGNPTVLELLQRTKRMALEVYRNQDVPFEYLLDAVQPSRTLSHSPLFQVMFAFQNTPETELKLPNLTFTGIPIPNETAKFDLTLMMQEVSGTLVAAWEYNCDLFEARTIERMTGHFVTLLTRMVQQPDAAISSLSLLSDEEHQEIVHNWNATAVEWTDSWLLHGGFEAQVMANPTAIALTYEQAPLTYQELTYEELNQRANQLAHRLHRQGVTTDVLVGVYMERSLEMVIAVLAILKAGGAYVPLDPTYPRDRIADTIADAEMPIILTQSQWAGQLPNHNAEVICVDSNLDTHAPNTNLNLELDPDQLAYVIYTSGSTGKPKGVMISHRGAVNTNLDINQRFGIIPGDRVIGLASLSFDLSVYDIFGFLAAGATLVIPNHQDVLNPAAWLRLMQAQQITFWNTAPAVMEMLMTFVSQQSQRLPDSLRVVMMSGDAISVTLPDQIRQHAQPQIQVYSFGGATEGSIWSIHYPIGHVDPSWTSIPYGTPLSNQRFHILDANLNPVPIGVAGELHIGGMGVAMGYFHRPELTAERFIPDPFYPGDRLYKTGDLGRYLPDGTIQFLGRIDHQVKIRGFRIELGEIEAAVTQYPGVQEASILVREDQPGVKQLCAYVVPESASTGESASTEKSSATGESPEPISADPINVVELKQALRQKLPDYMVPPFIVVLDRLPLTSNGKVDRKALPKPETSQATTATTAVPKNQLERQVAQVWSELLQITTIGRHDNFFDLGGQSMLMVQAQIRLQEVLGQDLNIVDLFQYPTIASLAEYLEHQNQQASVTEIVQQRTEIRMAQQSTLQTRRATRQQFRQIEDD